MNRRALERELTKLGWRFKKAGGRHDIWTNGVETEQVPRHNEINKYTAKSILETAQKYPGRRKE